MRWTQIKRQERGVLEILSTYRENRSGLKIYHTVLCPVCAKDPELHGDGIFEISRTNFNKGVFPCGCSDFPKWSEAQQKIRVGRVCKDRGYSVVGYTGASWDAQRSKLVVKCDNDGHEWTTTVAAMLVGRGCAKCKSKKLRTPDAEFESRWRATGKYPVAATFTRVEDKRDAWGCRVFWDYFCPVCDDVFETRSGTLDKGFLPCNCSSKGFDKTKASNFYVLKITGDAGDFTGFGVSGPLDMRLKYHRRELGKCGFQIDDAESFPMWGHEALKLEGEVKKNFERHSQNVEGFRTEATHSHLYLDVIAYAEEFLQRISDESKLTTADNLATISGQIH